MNCHSGSTGAGIARNAPTNVPGNAPTNAPGNAPMIALVGNPNVGKSVVFGALTGTYAVVSNYPGTTVEVTRGRARLGGIEAEVIDTPGMYGFMPVTEEEMVSRRLLSSEKPDLVVHVADAKNLERMLSLTFELLEAGFRTILVVNMVDEARLLGLRVDRNVLERRLGIPVVLTSAARREGLDELRAALGSALNGLEGMRGNADQKRPVAYGEEIERALKAIRPLPLSMALLALQGDEEAREAVACEFPEHVARVNAVVEETCATLHDPVSYAVAVSRRKQAVSICEEAVLEELGKQGSRLAASIDSLLQNPVWGIPLLLLVLYLGLYKFVGEFGAGTLVEILEVRFFEGILNPLAVSLADRFVPWGVLRSLFTGEYGLITLGLRYAFGIILPIVTTYFLVFSIMEDSGYLPRLAMLMDRVFKRMGLSGRAVIPMTLGFGCGTVATVVSRTLETRRERLIATLLLALAIPCSAQLGLIMGLLGSDRAALMAWIGFLLVVFVLVAYLTAKVIPGSATSFYMEIPPLRLPQLENVAQKTISRVHWYLIEVIPIFLGTSVLLWALDATGALDSIVGVITPVVTAIGLPSESARVFLYGFFRRDYGAAGLYDLQKAGLFDRRQLVTAATTLTLFLPCVAQFMVMVKERGLKTAVAIAGFIFPFAFASGAFIKWMLGVLGVLA